MAELDHNPPSINHQNHNPDNPLLPQDLIFSEILSRLPVKSLRRFKSVSKHWNSQISTPHFAKSHFARTLLYPFDPSSICLFMKSIRLYNNTDPNGPDPSTQVADHVIEVYGIDGNGKKPPSVKFLVKDNYCGSMSDRSFLIGSCNGLVCVVTYSTGRIVADNFHVYNPITSQYRKIENVVQDLSVSAFGYVRKLDDYRIVTFCMSKHGMDTLVYVYSLGSGEWRTLAGIHDYQFQVCHGNGVYVDDYLYYLVTLRSDPSEKYIVRFDMVDEKVSLIWMPYSEFGKYGCRLCVTDGSLCVWEESDVVANVELWRLECLERGDYWTKLVRLDGVRFHLLGGGGNFLYFRVDEKRLIYFDPYTVKFVDLGQIKVKHVPLLEGLGGAQVVNYVPTLVSPLADSDLQTEEYK